MAKKKHTQHDRLFRATFSIKSEAELFIKNFLPWDINQFLDYDTLELKNSSFINEHLENQFSDIIYACRWEESSKSVLLTFLFEHKSYPEKYPELQLLRYMLEGYQSQLKQKEELSLIIPIVLYHGKKKFNAKPFFEYLELPHPKFGRFMPNFEFIMADLSKYADEEILAIGMSFLTSSLLLFKHKQERDFVLHNYREIFIFVEGYKSRQETERFLETLITYVFQSFEIEQEEINEIADDLPKNVADMFVSTYDKAVESGQIRGVQIGTRIGIEKGTQIGIEKGTQIGIEKGKIHQSLEVAFSLFGNKNKMADSFISQITHFGLDIITSLREAYENQEKMSAQKMMIETLKPLGPITKMDEKLIDALLGQFFTK